jgi:hypothetical protein
MGYDFFNAMTLSLISSILETPTGTKKRTGREFASPRSKIIAERINHSTLRITIIFVGGIEPDPSEFEGVLLESSDVQQQT